VGAFGEMWSFSAIGRQYSPFLRIKKGHELIKNGPYAWIRHPLYSFGFPMIVGLGLTASNWFLLLTGLATLMVAVVARVPQEEAVLTEAFGDSYREYMRQTPALFPRIRRNA
jgi:protein-S-isoprenylcysteine O-methyltransferase Ste14